MPRKPRIDIPGLLQHVIVRGVARQAIFGDDHDRVMFMNRFVALLEDTGADCLAWALLDNHLHLLLRCNRTELSVFMRRLLTGYAISFNRRHQRSGHLFQDRYKSIVCDEDAYLLELVRYIHLNPLRAGMVADIDALDRYPWCGHSVLMGRRKLHGQAIDEVMVYFGPNIARGRLKYRRFIADGIPREDDLPWENHVNLDDRVLGDGEFVDRVRQKVDVPLLPPRLTLSELAERVCAFFGVPPDAVLRRTRGGAGSEARAVLCYAAVRLAGMKGVAVGEFLSMGPAAVSRAVQRGELIARNRVTAGTAGTLFTY